MYEPNAPYDQIDESSAPLVELDHRRLARVERSLDRASKLERWWESTARAWAHEYDGKKLAAIVGSNTHPDCFHLTRARSFSPETEASFGFFDSAPVDGQTRAVMGLFQQTLFDEPRHYFVRDARNCDAVLDLWHQDIREFALRHLIRLTGFAETAPYVDASRRPVESWLRPFSWCPSGEERLGGFGFSQIYYGKRDRKGVRVGKFRDADRHRIDLRTLDGEFEWIVVGIRIHDLYLRHPAIDWVAVPIQDEVLAVMRWDFVVDDAATDREGVRGRYGFGYAVLEDPAEAGPALMWRRPAFGFQRNEFVVQQNGRVLARSVMVCEKLPRLLDFNPVEWGRLVADRASLGLFSPVASFGFELVNRATPGMFLPFNRFLGDTVTGPRFDPIMTLLVVASNAPLDVTAELCISRDDILRSLLFDLVRSQMSTIIASRGIWRAVRNWTDADSLPAWVQEA